MTNAISAHLQKFERQILSLIPYADNDRLDFLVAKLLPEESSGRHLAVKNEIKKLSQQATKSIDLRLLFTNCEIVKHNKLVHHLDQPAKELFKQLLAQQNNLYTLAIYHEVYEDAQERAQAPNTAVKGQEYTEFQIEKTEPKPLVNKNRIQQETKQYNSSCKVFINPISGLTSQGKHEIGITATIDKMNNRKVVIQTSNEIKHIKANKVYLWLYDHHSEIDFTEELELGFVILEQQKSPHNNKFEYLLQFSSPITDKQMRILFAYYLRQKKLAIIGPTDRFITPLFDSITSKGYEQLYINKTHDIPLLCFKENNSWQAKIAMKTSGNDELWRFFTNEKAQFNLPLLLSNADIQQALNSRSTVDRYAFILKYSHNNTLQYGLMWYDEYVSNISVKSDFKRFFNNNCFKVIKISSSFVNAQEDAYVPSALPCHVHPKIAVLNRPTPKGAADVIADCDHLITVSDITTLFETIYHAITTQVNESEQLIDERYQLKAYPQSFETEIVTAENDDSRCEDRFKLRFKMAITRSNGNVTHLPGITKNVSTQGLLVTLAKESKFKAGEEIEISLTVPFAEQDKTVKKQKYVVLGYDSAGDVRLLMNSLESKHLGARAIRKYIYQNIDNLEACGKRGSHVYGLQKAVRNIYAHNHFSIPFYLKATKHQQYINAASFSGNSALKHLVYKNENSEDIILNLLSNSKFRNSCLSIIAVLADQKLYSKDFYILVLPKEEGEEDEGYSFWYRDLSVLKKSEQLKPYTEKVMNLGQPAILKVELKRSSEVRNMYYRDEISYLKSLDKDLANDIEVQLENTIGIGEVTDLTDIAMEMIANHS